MLFFFFWNSIFFLVNVHSYLKTNVNAHLGAVAALGIFEWFYFCHSSDTVTSVRWFLTLGTPCNVHFILAGVEVVFSFIYETALPFFAFNKNDIWRRIATNEVNLSDINFTLETYGGRWISNFILIRMLWRSSKNLFSNFSRWRITASETERCIRWIGKGFQGNSFYI